MGLASRLGYPPGDQNLIQRWIIDLASTRSLSAVSRRILPSLDRLALRITGGRSTVTAVTSGLPVLWLTTRGAKTGAERTVPLIGFPLDGDLAILGTHFGHGTTPGWVHNLEFNPDAKVAFRGAEVLVRARPADPREESATWDRAATAYPGYEEYAGRASHRSIRVFVLEPMEIDV
ncbi:MAG TPA: nitroreductase family deazaflavin-dependent oxidoreductase [Acidimicrobiia bacterium]|nr:nitroreductase family deazaflavin-dependent oxidoreductase [Acidimicrobiia bacterium]